MDSRFRGNDNVRLITCIGQISRPRLPTGATVEMTVVAWASWAEDPIKNPATWWRVLIMTPKQA